ncbi:5-formyltetrahydrofolate cyclo-ligase [Denitromonas iodatirespirans]|uniref:5-formyltetrahydrofolate cyclo-ligase n=1 Tax=Denitromonas iodatirespirans TaxID=2795389 RepID=A0A944DEV5_DENI1|nr:5-formyltetrahydrofolate cyclo-ligase [Denitromonas iodatirespirans]MBT0963133.1 5-formyltetrahydrofolate cyclo-ligase [Denitromonas iodatirespirans]
MEIQRKQLRDAAIRTREQLAATDRAPLETAVQTHVAALLDRLDIHRLAFCWPYRSEPDLRPVVVDWLDAAPGRQAALPVMVAPARPLKFREWTPASAMVPDMHGIFIPADGAELTPELLLIPLNAFDAAGYRLGYGGGYFDRTLAALSPAPRTVGVGFELGRVDTTHPQLHDHPMHWIVTEAGIHPVGGGA